MCIVPLYHCTICILKYSSIHVFNYDKKVTHLPTPDIYVFYGANSTMNLLTYNLLTFDI